METTKLTVEVDNEVMQELEYLIGLHRQYGAKCRVDSVTALIDLMLRAVADGSRRPVASEREILESLGIVADTDEHWIYRNFYGPPNGTEEQRQSLDGSPFLLRRTE